MAEGRCSGRVREGACERWHEAGERDGVGEGERDGVGQDSMSEMTRVRQHG